MMSPFVLDDGDLADVDGVRPESAVARGSRGGAAAARCLCSASASRTL